MVVDRSTVDCVYKRSLFHSATSLILQVCGVCDCGQFTERRVNEETSGDRRSPINAPPFSWLSTIHVNGTRSLHRKFSLIFRFDEAQGRRPRTLQSQFAHRGLGKLPTMYPFLLRTAVFTRYLIVAINCRLFDTQSMLLHVCICIMFATVILAIACGPQLEPGAARSKF